MRIEPSGFTCVRFLMMICHFLKRRVKKKRMSVTVLNSCCRRRKTLMVLNSRFPMMRSVPVPNSCLPMNAMEPDSSDR